LRLTSAAFAQHLDTNLLSSTIPGPINIALDDLTAGVTLINSNGQPPSRI
jgi:hypothetical protein